MLKSFCSNILIFILFIFSKTPSFGQTPTTVFLATAKTKTTILRQEGFTYKLPFVEKINIQTETDRYELQRQQYQTRVSFNGWEEMKQEKKWQQANINVEQADKNVLFQDVLLDRYALLIDYRAALKALNLYQKIYLVFADKRDVLQKMAKLSTNFNIEDLIKAEENAYQYQQKITQTEGAIKAMQQFSQRLFDSKDAVQLDTTNWLPLSKMRDFVANLSKNGINNALLSQQEAKINLAQANYNVEKAGTKKVIDYAQLKYGARQKDALQTELSIGLGFIIPYRGSSKTALKRLSFKQLEEKNKLEDIRESLDLQLFNAQQELQIILKEYDLVSQQINESQTLYSLDHYMQLQRQARLLDLEHEAFVKYLKLLYGTGKLAALPLQNYLSAGFEGF
jgi:hypothetical protein